MGAGNSTPSTNGTHVFSAEGPVRFSQSIVETLQDSPETDSTRSRDLELKVQTRVKAELEKIRDAEASRVLDLADRLTTGQDESTPASSTDDSDASTRRGEVSQSQKDRDYVAAEIAQLKSRLAKRRKVERADDGVEGARSELIACLVTKGQEGRSLDCWAEVDGFKREVARYERAFLERTLRG